MKPTRNFKDSTKMTGAFPADGPMQQVFAGSKQPVLLREAAAQMSGMPSSKWNMYVQRRNASSSQGDVCSHEREASSPQRDVYSLRSDVSNPQRGVCPRICSVSNLQREVNARMCGLYSSISGAVTPVCGLPKPQGCAGKRWKAPSVVLLLPVIAKEFLFINLKNLRNDQHFQFMSDVGGIIDEFGPEELKIETLFEAFGDQYQVEDEALKTIRKSTLTAKIKVADKRRNDIFLGLSDICRVYAARHFNGRIQAMATDLLVVFDSYGNLSRKQLIEKTSAISNLVQELRNNHGEEIEDTGLVEWIDKLHDYNVDCNQLIQGRWVETADKKAKTGMKDARAGVDAAYGAMMRRIMALREVNGDEIYDSLLRRLEVIIDSYNAALHHGGKKSGDEGSSDAGNGSLPVNH